MRLMTIFYLLIQVSIPLCVSGQGAIENGKYFYSYVGDSILFYYSRSGDTLTYWTLGLSTAYEMKKLKKIERRKGFGKFIQRGSTLSDGRVMIHELKPEKYLTRNDSLFQWHEVYRLSEDSIKILKTAYESTKIKKEQKRVDKIIESNTEFRFVFIFHPALFDKGSEQLILDEQTKCQNTVTLLFKWSTDQSDYYRIEITNNCGSVWGHRWGYIVSKRGDFVAFGGYSSKEARLLTRANLVWGNLSDY